MTERRKNVVVYIQVDLGIAAADAGLLGLRQSDEDEGSEGYLRVVTTETTLVSHVMK